MCKKDKVFHEKCVRMNKPFTKGPGYLNRISIDVVFIAIVLLN